MTRRNVVYEPPAADVVDHFAFDACRGLGGDFNDREVAEGFASFMKVIARTLAKDLNRNQSSVFDMGIE